MKIYGDIISGNCYKTYLVASLLDLPIQWVTIDIMDGGTRSASFLQKNPNGKIPLLELDDGRMLAESNAIINYMAFGSQLLPDDRYALAKVLEWQFFEQYSHEPYIAVARFIQKYQGLPESRRAEYESKRTGGYKALDVMERQLSKNRYLVGEQLTVADISLFAYTHVADEGGFSLEAYPGINAWINRIRLHPRFVRMVLKPQHQQ